MALYCSLSSTPSTKTEHHRLIGQDNKLKFITLMTKSVVLQHLLFAYPYLFCLSLDAIRDNIKPLSGRVDRATVTKTVDSSSVPGRVKPKIIKIGVHSLSA